MSYYRLYFLNGARIERAEELHAGDDVEAMRVARARAASHAVELWCGARKVGAVSACQSPMRAVHSS